MLRYAVERLGTSEGRHRKRLPSSGETVNFVTYFFRTKENLFVPRLSLFKIESDYANVL